MGGLKVPLETIWRIGYEEQSTAFDGQDNRGTDSLLTHSLNRSGVKHEVGRKLDVIRCLGGRVAEDGLELWVGPQDEEFAQGFLKRHGVVGRDVIIGFGPSGALQL